MEVAGLYIAAPHDEVKAAKGALTGLSGAAKQAEAAVKGMGGAAAAANANAKALAASSQQEAAALNVATTALRVNGAAAHANAAATRSAALAQRNMIYQVNDVVVSLASGMSFGMVAIQQGSQIFQNGIGNALTALRGLAVSTLTAFWPLLAVLGVFAGLLAGVQREINKTAKTQVSFFDVVIAGWELAAEAVGRFFGPAIAQVGKWLGELWDWMAPLLSNIGNTIVAVMVGSYNTVVKTWNMLPDAFASLFIKAMNGAIDIVQGAINGILDPVNLLLDKVGMSKIPTADLEKFKGTASGADVEVGNIANREFSAAFATDWMGAAGAAWSKRAQQVANRPSKDAAEKAAKEAERQAKAYNDLVTSSQQFIAAKDLEVQSLGMTEEAAARLRYQQEMLNKAANDNIALGPSQRAEIEALAGSMAAAEEKARVFTEAYDFGKSTFRSFFADLKADLMSGTSLWDTFSSAGMKALDSLTDRMIQMASDQVFNMLFSSFSSGLSGGLGSVSQFRFGGMSFAGGGDTGWGPRAGGVDGQGGFPAILHPRERVIDYAAAANQNAPRAANSNLSVHIHNNAGVDVRTEKRNGTNGEELHVTLDRMVASKVSQPGTATHSALTGVHGTEPQLTRR